ncbi:MAG: M23 family metallopeptidase [Microbacterium sp.]
MRKPLRSLATLAVVAGLVATVAIPAYGALRSAPEAKTIQQVAQDDAQSLIVASEVETGGLDRDSYAATTPEEIAKKKAAEAAKLRASMYGTAATVDIDLSLVGPGTGPVRWPLATITRIGDGFLSRGGAHYGVDLISPGGTPIFASTDGVVRVSQESYFGYGVAVVIDGVIDGRKVTTLYAHMRYGSRTVGVGTHVKAGQIIGLVGATGRAYGNHLHFETRINGSLVDPLAFLRENAG